MSFGEQDITMNCLKLPDTFSCQCLLNGSCPRTIDVTKHLRFHAVSLNSSNNLIGIFGVECHWFVKIDMFSCLRAFCPDTSTAFYICTETDNMHVLTCSASSRSAIKGRFNSAARERANVIRSGGPSNSSAKATNRQRSSCAKFKRNFPDVYDVHRVKGPRIFRSAAC